MTGSRLSFAVALLAIAGAAGFAAACTSSTSASACGSGTPPVIVGTYALQSYDVGGTLVSPASGQLRLNANDTYAATVFLPQPTGTIADSGTYTIRGASCIDQNSVLGQPQFVGTFTLVGTTLAVTGAAGGEAVTSVWTKTS